jgi:hypothetical protein
MQIKLMVLLLTVMVFTGCSKADYDLNPWTTVLNKLMKEKNETINNKQ